MYLLLKTTVFNSYRCQQFFTFILYISINFDHFYILQVVPLIQSLSMKSNQKLY
jgi:hypothetical protein